MRSALNTALLCIVAVQPAEHEMVTAIVNYRRVVYAPSSYSVVYSTYKPWGGGRKLPRYHPNQALKAPVRSSDPRVRGGVPGNLTAQLIFPHCACIIAA